MSSSFSRLVVMALAGVLAACGGETPPEVPQEGPALPPAYSQNKYATVSLAPDLQALGAGDREALPLLVGALESIDRAFWLQIFGPKAALLDSIGDPDARRFAEINYGPWDRLDEYRPFLSFVPMPAAAGFYPVDLGPAELEQAGAASADGGASLRDPYTVVQRGENRVLEAVPFHEVYSEAVQDAAGELSRASELVSAPSLRRYLELRAEALTRDSYGPSDEAWLEVEGALGVAIGPMGLGEDGMHQVKRAYTGALWIEQPQWSSRLNRYRSLLPELAELLTTPVSVTVDPAVTFDVVDLIHLSGKWNAGPKLIVLDLPAETSVRKQSGTRRLPLHNVARAKFDSTLVPLAGTLISEGQRDGVTFDAFFTSELVVELIRAGQASETDRALRTVHGHSASVVAEARASAIGAYLAGELAERGESGVSRDEHYITLVAGSFRSLRSFGTTSAQGPAALILLNWLERKGAIAYDRGTTAYRVDVEKVQRSVRELAEKLAGAHDPAKASELRALLAELVSPGPAMVADINRLATARVPIDVAFAH